MEKGWSIEEQIGLYYLCTAVHTVIRQKKKSKIRGRDMTCDIRDNVTILSDIGFFSSESLGF